MATSPIKTITNDEGTFNVREGSRMDIAAGENPTIPPPAPTIADTYSKATINLGDTSKEDKAYANQESRLKRESSAKVDENSIFKNQMKKFQAEIDATNSIYAQKLADQKQVGLGALGSSRAVQARSGLLGSDYGLSQTSGVQSDNLAQEDLVRQEQSAKVQAILGKGRAAAVQELAEKRAAQQAGQKDYIDFLGASAERRSKRSTGLAEQFLDQEVDPDKIDPAELARIAKQSGVQVADIKSSYMKTKKARAEKAAADALEGQFSLSPEEMRFDATGKLLAQGGPKTYAPSDSLGKIVKIGGVDYVQNSDGSFSLPDVPGSADPVVATTQLSTAKNALAKAKELASASGRGRSWVEGISQGLLGATDYTNLEAYANTLRTSILTLATDPTIKKFFGPQMSNADVQLMTSAGTALNPELMSPEQFNAELVQLEALLNRLEASVPAGGAGGGNARSKIDAAGYDYDALKAQYPGVPDEEHLQNLGISFRSVGNTTASAGNLPQRNNNPGNVKIGGIGDRFASKDALGRPMKDAQGHLIFPNPQAGLMALEADIDAKITGNSQAAQNKLGKQIGNLAELNMVYAEDPNWKNNVIAYLGRQGVRANASTPVSSIPKQQLIQAIMQSEGYYA